MNIVQPANQQVIAHFSRRDRTAPALALPGDFSDPYYSLGCHPDIVERIWDKLNPTLPADCRRVIYGTPGLVHSYSGIIFGLGYGTQYCLRLPAELHQLAIERGAATFMRWSGGQTTDILQELGSDWSFGHWDPLELDWCRQAYEQYL